MITLLFIINTSNSNFIVPLIILFGEIVICGSYEERFLYQVFMSNLLSIFSSYPLLIKFDHTYFLSKLIKYFIKLGISPIPIKAHLSLFLSLCLILDYKTMNLLFLFYWYDKKKKKYWYLQN